MRRELEAGSFVLFCFVLLGLVRSGLHSTMEGLCVVPFVYQRRKNFCKGGGLGSFFFSLYYRASGRLLLDRIGSTACTGCWYVCMCGVALFLQFFLVFLVFFCCKWWFFVFRFDPNLSVFEVHD